MRTIPLLILLCVFTGCATSPQKRLIGTWKSNKELTVQTLHYKKEPPERLRKKIEGLFGKLEVTYTGNKLHAYAPDLGFKAAEWNFNTKYKVLGSDSTSLVVLATDPLTEELKITHIHFEGDDRYWVYIMSTGWKEYFDRIR